MTSSADDAAAVRPNRLGHYELLEQIGQGGMAVVYRGVQPSLNRQVAIKVLPARFSVSPELVARFEREANIVAQLNHPNIVQIIDRGREGETLFLVMEFVEGESLDKVIARRSLPVGKAIDYALQVCDAMEDAHSKGIVHRDLKPSNVLIDAKTGRVKIADFGIAQIGTTAPGVATLTSDNTALGTMNYMSPEQRTDSHNVTHLTDIFSFGVVLYEMLTGRLPIGHFKQPSQLNRDVPLGLDIIVKKCLEVQPEDRYQSFTEIRRQLSQITGWGTRYKVVAQRVGESVRQIADSTTPWMHGKRRYIAAAAGVIVILAAVLLLLPRGQRPAPAAGTRVDTPITPATAPRVTNVASPVGTAANQPNLHRLIKQARDKAAVGDWKTALKDLDALITLHKTQPSESILVALAYYETARIYEDRTLYDRALTEYDHLLHHVRLFAQLGDTSPDLLAFASAAMLQKATVLGKQAETHKRKEDAEKCRNDALELYRVLIRQYPESPDSVVAQAALDWSALKGKMDLRWKFWQTTLRYNAADQEAILSKLERVLDEHPNSPLEPAALRLAAAICEKPDLSNLQAAAEKFERLADLEPDWRPDHLHNAAESYHKAGNFNAEQRLYSRFVAEFPNDRRVKAARRRLAELETRAAP